MRLPAITTRRLAIAILALSLFAPLAMADDTTGDGVVAKGTKWVKKTQKIHGAWSIVKEGDQHFVVLDSKFKTKSAPDLKLFLTPDTAKNLTNKNALKNGVLIAKLKSAKGAQRYKLPAKAVKALGNAKSLIIHCEKYTKLWGVAELKIKS